MIFSWFKRLLSGRPHFIIGGAEPYMLRWWLLPQNPWFNIYLHKFLRDDDDRALHDHPWRSLSIVLWGGYDEITEDGTKWYGAGSVIYRHAEYRHRVVISRTGKPCWTLFIRGRKVRGWGFWCPKGFVPWRQFVASNDPGSIGAGCGEGDNGGGANG